MFEKCSENEFKVKRREKLLSYDRYSANFDDCEDAFLVVTRSIKSPHPNATAYNLVEATSERAFCAFTHLTNCYSGGHSVADLRSFFPTVVEYWEAYDEAHRAYHTTKPAGSNVANISLLGSNFFQANGLICFAILLGLRYQVHQLLPIIDYNNPQKDGMLERLIKFVVPGRGSAPEECTRHLPYSKTFKIFKAGDDERAEAVANYLDDWFHASRREPYYNSEKRPSFAGYWAYEAAAITFLLDIDDSAYRDAAFYPKDLADFARSARANYESHDTEPITYDELRTRSGDLCPRTGEWVSLDGSEQPKHFKFGERIPDSRSSYGFTVWRYLRPQ